MEVTFYGHSCFRIKGKKGTAVIDPYNKDIGFLMPKVKTDLVLSTHDHVDHNDFSRVEDYRLVVKGVGSYEVGEIEVDGYSSWHDEKKGQERGENIIYKIKVDDVWLVHLGDLGEKLSDKLIEELSVVDILFIPVGGNYTIDADQAVEIVNKLSPSIVIPMHFKEEGKEVDVESVDEFIKKMDKEVKRVDRKIKIGKDDLSEDVEVVLMSR